MTTKQLLLVLACGCLIVGCKGSDSSDTADKTAPATPDASTKTADATAKPDDTAAKTDDATKTAAGGKSLVGTWDFDAPGSKSASYEFKDDGTAVITVVGDGPDKKGTMTVVVDETYKVDGDNLTMQPTDMKMSTDEDSQKDAVASQEKALNDQLKGVPPGTGPITWKDDNDVSFTLDTPAFGKMKEEKKTVNLKKHAG